MQLYSSTTDYITHNIAPGLGDVELTNDQALEIAQTMTEWHNEYDADGNILLGKSGLVERTDLDFWDVVAEVIGIK